MIGPVVREVVKLGVGIVASSGIDKILEFAVARITPDRVLTTYEKVAVKVGTASVGLALSSIVSREIDEAVDGVYNVVSEVKSGKGSHKKLEVYQRKITPATNVVHTPVEIATCVEI